MVSPRACASYNSATAASVRADGNRGRLARSVLMPKRLARKPDVAWTPGFTPRETRSIGSPDVDWVRIVTSAGGEWLIPSAYSRIGEKDIDMLEFRMKLALRRRRALRAGACLAALTPLAIQAALAGPAQAAVASGAAGASGSGCATQVIPPIGPFHIGPDKRTVIDHNSRPFVSYGTTVPGLSNPNLTTFPKTDKPKINATANLWCGNTIR